MSWTMPDVMGHRFLSSVAPTMCAEAVLTTANAAKALTQRMRKGSAATLALENVSAVRTAQTLDATRPATDRSVKLANAEGVRTALNALGQASVSESDAKNVTLILTSSVMKVRSHRFALRQVFVWHVQTISNVRRGRAF